MSRKAQPEVSITSIALAVIVGLFDAGFMLVSPVNSWFIILAIWGGGPIIGNIINFFAARTIRKASRLNPYLLILLSIIFQIVMISAGILLIMSAKSGRVVSCADACSETSFGEELWSILVTFQLFFAGAYIGFFSCDVKNRKRKKKSTRRKAA